LPACTNQFGSDGQGLNQSERDAPAPEFVQRGSLARVRKKEKATLVLDAPAEPCPIQPQPFMFRHHRRVSRGPATLRTHGIDQRGEQLWLIAKVKSNEVPQQFVCRPRSARVPRSLFTWPQRDRHYFGELAGESGLDVLDEGADRGSDVGPTEIAAMPEGMLCEERF